MALTAAAAKLATAHAVADPAGHVFADGPVDLRFDSAGIGTPVRVTEPQLAVRSLADRR